MGACACWLALVTGEDRGLSGEATSALQSNDLFARFIRDLLMLDRFLGLLHVGRLALLLAKCSNALMRRLELLGVVAALVVGCLVGGLALAQAEKQDSERVQPTSTAGSSSPASSAAPAVSSAAEPERPVAGYSWGDGKRKLTRKAKKRPRSRRVTIDPSKPHATYPGFMMLPDGRSVIWLYVSSTVPVASSLRAGRFVVSLPGVQVGVRNITNPLETAHFRTPLTRAHLQRTKGGAELVLRLREAVTPKHEALPGPRGTMVVRVLLPKATKRYAPAPLARPSTQAGSNSASSGGPGPRP